MFVVAGLYIFGCIKNDSGMDKALTIILDIIVAVNCIFYTKGSYIFYAEAGLPASAILSITILEFIEFFCVYGAIAIAKNKNASKKIVTE